MADDDAQAPSRGADLGLFDMTNRARAVPPLVLFMLAVVMTPALAADLSDDARTADLVIARLAQPDAVATVHPARVVVRDGVAIIEGSARNRYALAAAVRVVGQVPGVRRVDARMRIEPNP